MTGLNPRDSESSFWNGIFRESINFMVYSSGGVITGSLSADSGLDYLTIMFSDGLKKLDVSTPLTIQLTPGGLSTLQNNYIYVPKSTKVLTVSTSGWPSEEHARVSFVSLLTATQTENDGAQVNQNINDHLANGSLQGHLTHISNRIRKGYAIHDEGTLGSLTIDGNDVFVAVTSGMVSQLHEQVYVAMDMQAGDDIHVVNNLAQPFITQSNLNTQVLDALGVSLANSSFSFVLWGVQNRTGQKSHMMLNLPTGKYSKNSPETAVSDPLNKSVYTIPRNYSGRGFLIARFTLTLEANGTTWSLYDTEDLRGRIPGTTGGGIGGGVTQFKELSDTPSDYIGQKGKIPRVKQTEDGLDFSNQPVTIVNNPTYTVLESDQLIHAIYTPTGTMAIIIPTAIISAGKEITIVDGGGNCLVNNITVSTEGAETIIGQPTRILDINYESITLYSDGSNWFIK